MEQIGSVPVYVDNETGDVFVDPADVGAMGQREEQTGFIGRRGRVRRLRQRQERTGRRLAAAGEGEDDAPIHDLYQHAVALGAVTENQFQGIGYATIAATTAGFVASQCNRNLWGKGMVLDSDDAPSMTVTGMSVAGLPINIGAVGAPLSMFQHDSTRWGLTFGRRIALTGQIIRVDAFNNDSSAHSLSAGVVADEMNPYMSQAIWERLLVQAAVDMMGG